MPKTDSKKTVGWDNIDWAKVERYVFKLQKRIYVASRRGDVKQVRKLQKTLMRSWSNRVKAVRRVTQECDSFLRNQAVIYTARGIESLSKSNPI